MFETIAIRRQASVGPQVVDAGFLAETLLFYGRVRLFADRGMLEQLIRGCGPSVFIDLISSGRLEVAYLPEGLAIKTEQTGSPQELHQPITYSIVEWSHLQNVLPRLFQEVTGRAGRGRRLAGRAIAHIHELTYDREILAAAKEDYADASFMSNAAAAIIRHLAPGYSVQDGVEFRTDAAGEMLRVTTNVDFGLATAAHHAHFGEGIGSLTPGFILSSVLNSAGDLQLAALHSSELATDPLTQSLINLKCRELLAGRNRREEQMELFQDLTLKHAHAIREAVNSGERTFEDVLRLLERADRFREWLQTQNPTVDLVTSYYRDATKDSWATALPVRALRWAVAVAAGIGVGGLGPTGVALTAGLGAADMFLLERWAAGWRPNQFVEGSLVPFVAGK